MIQAERPTIDQIFKAMSATGNSPRWLLQSDRRDTYIVKDRVAVSLVMRNILGMSWSAIGRELKRNHANVMRACERYVADKDVTDAYGKVCARLSLYGSCAQAGGAA